jgi:uncharacterized protein involved in exopolysaccharide biosynthesis
MAEQPPAPSNPVFYYEDEFDPRPYIEALVGHWWLIIGLAFVAAVAAFVIRSLLPAEFTAEADVSLLNVRSEVVFDPQFITVPLQEGVLPNQASSDRRDALHALAESRSLLTGVFLQVSPQLEPGNRDFDVFRDAVEAEAAGDLLRLRVTWDDPELAAQIANEWARRFAAMANQSYVGTSSSTPDEASAAADDVFEKYQAAQADLGTFIAENDLDQVRREIAELDTLIEELQTQRTDALRLANETSALSANRLANTTREVLLEQMDASLRRQAEDRVRELDYWYERKIYLEGAQFRLEDLEAQLEEGNTSSAAASGDAMAVMFTRANLFRQGPAPEMLLDIDLAQLGEDGYLLASSDVQDLRSVVEEALAEANTEIERLTDELFLGTNLKIPGEIPADHQLFQLVNAQVEAMLNLETMPEADLMNLEARPLTRTLTQLSSQRQVLRAQLEGLEAQERELVRARDTAWDLYKTLSNKAREAEAQFATGAPQARLAIQATPPVAEDRRGRLLLSVLAAALGGMIGVVYVLGRGYWQSGAPEAAPGTPTEEAPAPPLPEPQPAVE